MRSLGRWARSKAAALRNMSTGRPDVVYCTVEAMLEDGRAQVKRDSWPFSIYVPVVPHGALVPAPSRQKMFFEDGDRNKPFIYWPATRGKVMSPLVAQELAFGEWQTFMQNAQRGGHIGTADAGPYELTDNVFGTVTSGTVQGVSLVRIRDGFIYLTKRSGSGSTTIDTIGRYANGHAVTPSHTSARPGPVLDMAFDPETGDLFAVELEDLGNLLHSGPSKFAGGTSYAATTNWPTTWNTITFACGIRSRIVRLSSADLSTAWTSDWHSLGLFCGCSEFSWGTLGGGYAQRTYGGNVISFFGDQVQVLGRRVSGDHMMPHSWTFDIGDGAPTTSTTGAVRLSFDTPPYTLIGTWYPDNPTLVAADVSDASEHRYPTVNGPMPTGWYGMDSAANAGSGTGRYRPGPLVCGNPLPIPNMATAGNPMAVAFRAASDSTGCYDSGCSRSWISFPRQSVSVLGAQTRQVMASDGYAKYPLFPGMSQFAGFTPTGTRKWIKRGWDEEGYRERYIPLLGSRGGKLLVRTTRERIRAVAEYDATTGASDPSWVGNVIDSYEVFYDVYSAATGRRTARNKASTQLSFSSAMRVPTGALSLVGTGGPLTGIPHLAGIIGGGAGSGTSLTSWHADGFYFRNVTSTAAYYRQDATTVTVPYDHPALPHHALNCSTTPDEKQIIFGPAWYSAATLPGGNMKAAYQTSSGVTVEELGAGYETHTAVNVVSYNWSMVEQWRNEISTVGAADVTFSNVVAYSNTRCVLCYRKDEVGFIRVIATADDDDFSAGDTVEETTYSTMTNTPFSASWVPNEHHTDELLIAGTDFLITLDRGFVITLQP